MQGGGQRAAPPCLPLTFSRVALSTVLCHKLAWGVTSWFTRFSQPTEARGELTMSQPLHGANYKTQTFNYILCPEGGWKGQSSPDLSFTVSLLQQCMSSLMRSSSRKLTWHVAKYWTARCLPCGETCSYRSLHAFLHG